jgi:hypothetical protein
MFMPPCPSRFLLSLLAAGFLVPAQAADAAIKTFIVDLGPGRTISGTMDIGTLGDPIVLNAKFVDAAGISPVVFPLNDMDAAFTATRVYRGGAAMVIETYGDFAALTGLESSFCILQWDDVATKFQSTLWAPLSTPIDYLSHPSSSMSICSFEPDPSDPFQTFVEMPNDLLLVVIEDYVTNPPMLDGFVFLPGVDGCWGIRFAPIQSNPPLYQPVESDPVPAVVSLGE